MLCGAVVRRAHMEGAWLRTCASGHISSCLVAYMAAMHASLEYVGDAHVRFPC